MSNKGLKAYTKQITQSLSDLAEMSINLNKNDSNLHINIPLISSVGLNQIKTSLVFNYQDIGISGLFGHGFKLNYFAKLSELSDRYTIKNADGSTDEYLASESYENKETKLKIEKKYDDQYHLTYHYEVSDKYDNVMSYYSDLDYPKYIKQKNGDKLSLDFIAATKTISNQYGDEIRFIKSSNVITKVSYFHNSNEVAYVNLEYDGNDYLTKICTKNSGVTVSEISISYFTNYIIIQDNISGQRIKYNISNGKVSSFVEGFDSSFTNSHPITIEYEDNKTTVSDYQNNKSYVFFDNNNFPLFEMDSEGNVIETEYNPTTKLLESKSDPVQVIHKETNLFPSSVANFSRTNVNVSHVDCDVPFFSNILGNTIYRVTGTSNYARLSYSVNISGIATDDIFVVLWGKQLTPKTDISYVKVSVSAGDTDEDTFKKESIDGFFDLMTLGSSAKRSFSQITLDIEIRGYASIELGGLQVIKKSFGSFYQYDNSGNTTEIGNGGTTANIKYNSNNLPTLSIGGDSSMYDYEYDDNGNLTTAKSSYGSKITNTYDNVYKNNLTYNKVSTRDGSINLETKKTYSSDGRFVTEEYDELLHKTSYDHDSLGRITKVINALNVETRANYNNDGTINQLLTCLNNDSSYANYTYDNKKRLSSITLKNGSVYTFVYDARSNITSILLNNNVLFVYNYDNNTGNILSQKYGTNGDLYRFEYDTDGLITKTYYEKGSNSVLKYKYTYNNLKQLTKVTDGSNNTLCEYSYDSEGRVVKDNNNFIEIKKVYDNLGNVTQKSIKKNNGNVFNQSFDSIERSKGAHPEALLGPYTQDDLQFVGTFMTDSGLKSKTKILKSISHSGNLTTFTPQFDGIIPYLKVNSSNLLSYQLAVSSYYLEESGCVQFWFKPYPQYYSTQQYLFSCKSFSGSSYIGIYIQNGKLYLKVTDIHGSTTTLLTSDYTANMSSWNFMALTFMNRYDGQGYPDVCEYALMLNGHTQIFKKQDPRIYCEIGPNPVYNIGHNYNGSYVSGEFNGDIACLFIGARKYSDLNDIRSYYRTTKDYFIDNQLVDSNIKTVDFSQTNYFNISQTNQNLFEIFPLQSSVVSLKGTKPIEFDLRNVSSMDKDRTFNFNTRIKRYAYVADGSKLTYNFGTGDSGTVMLRAYTDSREEKQYLFELVDENNKHIGLYRGSDSKLYIDFNGNIISTNLIFANDSWNTVALSFQKTIQPVGYGTLEYEYFRVKLNGSIFNDSVLSFTNIGTFKLYVGRKKEGISNVSNLGAETNYFPLLGQIEMLAFRNAYCEESTLNALANELVGITKINEFDELGMLKRTNLHKAGVNILSNALSYKKRSAYSTYYSKEISSEKIYLNNSLLTNRTYETDNLGNVITVTDSVFGSHNYGYDYRGFLTNDDGTNIIYDNNGNIKQYGSINYGYDSQLGIKDLLTSVGGKTITYDNNNLFNPVSYDGKSFEYEGRRLTKFTNSNNVVYNYKYNDKGLRIEKTVNGLTMKFAYDNDKLVSQIKGNEQIDFLYDENSSLYGFILNNNDKYFYVRDTLQNILGIINDSGTLVVKYTYNAYGKILSITGSLASTIGVINPFKYKGYYYDEESGMYYCNSRYYVPEWCRWLNADNPLYISGEDSVINNIFCYCSNNPIVYLDNDGHIFFFAALIIGAVVGTVVNAGISIATQLATGEHEVNWKKVALDGAIGAVSGIVAASGAGVVASAIIGGALGAVGSIGNDLIDSNGDWSKVNVGKAIVMGGVGALTSAFISGAGSQNSTNIGKGLMKNGDVNKLFTRLANGVSDYLSGNISKRGMQGIFNLYGKAFTEAVTKALPGVVAKETSKSLLKTGVCSIISAIIGAQF